MFWWILLVVVVVAFAAWWVRGRHRKDLSDARVQHLRKTSEGYTSYFDNR